MLTRSTTTHPPNPHGYSVHHQQHTIISPVHIPVHSRNSARRLSPPIASSCEKGSVGRRRLDKRPFFFLPSFSPFCFFKGTANGTIVTGPSDLVEIYAFLSKLGVRHTGNLNWNIIHQRLLTNNNHSLRDQKQGINASLCSPFSFLFSPRPTRN